MLSSHSAPLFLCSEMPPISLYHDLCTNILWRSFAWWLGVHTWCFFQSPNCVPRKMCLYDLYSAMHDWATYRPFSHCIDQAGLGAFTAKSGRKHYNPPPLTVMWMNFDPPNFPSFCSLSAIISFQTCSNKCILYVFFHFINVSRSNIKW